MAYVAGATTTIRLGTGILILPQRNPLILAKELATLDRLSAGRLELGVGVGWLREEFDALGIPWEARGARTDEYIDVLRTLWREPEASYDGSFTNFAPLKSWPKPAREGGPKVHIGGHTPAAARRAGRTGDGFFPGATGEDLGPLLDEMRRAAKDAGRDADAIEITSGGGLDLDAVRRVEDLGASRFVIPPLGFDLETLKNTLGAFSENVIARCLTGATRSDAAAASASWAGLVLAVARVRRRVGRARQRVGDGQAVVALREHRVDLVHGRRLLRPLPPRHRRNPRNPRDSAFVTQWRRASAGRVSRPAASATIKECSRRRRGS